MLLRMENWKSVLGFEGIYEVSDRGGVRSVDRTTVTDAGVTRQNKGRPLRPGKASNGYHTVALCKGGKPRSHTVHELVAAAFLGPRPEGYDIDHIDGCRTNNLPANLRYVSHATNGKNITKVNAKSGEIGVYPNGKGWQAQVVSDGRKIYLGTFPTVQAAKEARSRYEQENDHRGLNAA